MNITKEENLVMDCFYWVTRKDEKETIALVKEWYGEIIFYVCGNDFRYDLKDFIDVTPVCLIKH